MPRTETDIDMSYHASATAILLVDPYNDFLSEGGKLWPRIKAVAEEAEWVRLFRSEALAAGR